MGEEGLKHDRGREIKITGVVQSHRGGDRKERTVTHLQTPLKFKVLRSLYQPSPVLSKKGKHPSETGAGE